MVTFSKTFDFNFRRDHKKKKNSSIKYVPDSYHVGIRLLELKILPSLAIYFDGFFFTSFEVYKISTWVSCRFYFNFHFFHIIWTTDTKGKFIKTAVPKNEV